MHPDVFLVLKFNSLAGQFHWLDAAAIFFAAYFEFFVCVFLFLMVVLAAPKDRLTALIYIGLAYLAAVVARFNLTAGIHWLWPNPRPFISHDLTQLIMPDTWSSFPSGHASFLFALSTPIFLYNRKFGLFCYVSSFLIVLARVFSGVHYPSDILAGAAIGIFTGWLVVKVFRKLEPDWR